MGYQPERRKEKRKGGWVPPWGERTLWMGVRESARGEAKLPSFPLFRNLSECLRPKDSE